LIVAGNAGDVQHRALLHSAYGVDGIERMINLPTAAWTGQVLQRRDASARSSASAHELAPGDRSRGTGLGKTLNALVLLLLSSVEVSASAQATMPSEPTGFAAAADVRAQVAAMRRSMKPGQGFLWQPLVRGGRTVAALEYWKTPGLPAVHPAEAEYAIVIEGKGTLVSGGALVDEVVRRPGLVEGSRIQGGTTRRLAVGDVMLIPAGTPHYFGMDGDGLVLLGIKLPLAPP
jgi:mannose-6-phosphate isomerase-like protein (cupin superfamily)